MSDEIDIANDTAQRHTDARVTALRAQAANIPAGTAGHCDLCGEWSGRLVRGACAPCRDRLRLP